MVKVGLPLIKNVLIQLAKTILIALRLTVVGSAAYLRNHKKLLVSEVLWTSHSDPMLLDSSAWELKNW